MKLTVVQKTMRGLATTGVLFLVAVISMGYLSYKLYDLDYWTIHTHKVIEELKDSLTALQDVETAERGYLVTMSPEFLEPLHWGMPAVKRHIDQVQGLTTDNPEEQTAVERLRALAQEKMIQSQANVKGDQANDPLVRLTVQREGKHVMDTYREQINVMIGNEEKLLRVRVNDLRFFQNAIWTTTGCFTAMAIALLSWVYQITRKAIEDEKQRVADLNTEVEQRKRIEKALKDTTINLTRSNADLQQFAYVASHDLQEPLRAVSGFLTLLASKQADKLDADSQRYITHAVEGEHRMRALVNDLLTYARVESRAKDFETVKLSQPFCNE